MSTWWAIAPAWERVPSKMKETWRPVSLHPFVTGRSSWRFTLNFLRLWLHWDCCYVVIMFFCIACGKMPSSPFSWWGSVSDLYWFLVFLATEWPFSQAMLQMSFTAPTSCHFIAHPLVSLVFIPSDQKGRSLLLKCKTCRDHTTSDFWGAVNVVPDSCQSFDTFPSRLISNPTMILKMLLRSTSYWIIF